MTEAGGHYEVDNGNASVIPGDASFYAGTDANDTQSLIDWGFVTTPQAVSYANYVDSYATWIRLALQKIGLASIDGFNTGNLLGSAWITWTINPKNGQRCSSQLRYLRQAIKKTTSPQIYTHALAEKVLFNGTTATGVFVSTAGSYGTPGMQFVLQANKGVIVSARTFQSPQLLMVSGVGPSQMLEAYNIPVVRDLPGVGQNMLDQPSWGLSIRVKLPTVSAMLNDSAYAASVAETYNENGTGLLSEFSSGSFGWERIPQESRSGFSDDTESKLNQFPEDWPEAELLGTNAYVGYQGNYQVKPIDGTNYAGVAAALITPSSRGKVSINSSSMADPPLINPNWLTDPPDQQLAVAIFKRQREIFQPLQNLKITYDDEVVPGAAVQTDQQILDFSSRRLAPIWHAAATCKIGQASDLMAVVDSQTRVLGTQGLSVVDASAFPFLTPGHPQSVIYMLTEKIAAQILQGA